jgi:tetratricopeptide (TPR) repeat protein
MSMSVVRNDFFGRFPFFLVVLAVLISSAPAVARRNFRYCMKDEDGISDTAMHMTVAEARLNVVAALERMNRDGDGLKNVEPIQHVRVLPQMFEFLDNGTADEGGPYSEMRYFRFQDMEYACIERFPFNGYALQVAMDNNPPVTGRRLFLFGYRGSGSRPADSDRANARLLVDSVNRLIVEAKNGNPTDAAEWADFKIKAAAWRAQAAKPPFPEEARKCRVLAEDALEGKKFDTALKYYEDALQVFPMWPEGYFNAGMICAEIGDYTNALRHMHHYLELTPDAPDARAARDKTYIWEGKASEIEAQSQHGENTENEGRHKDKRH